jgi:hypothetical protein
MRLLLLLEFALLLEVNAEAWDTIKKLLKSIYSKSQTLQKLINRNSSNGAIPDGVLLLLVFAALVLGFL